jgi:alpha-beta hydrolase superfamily lysophospholipase
VGSRIEIERQFIAGDGFQVPAVLLMPANPAGAVVIVHGYGGSKEEQLGLAWRVAESGFIACAIDLRGHGEHRLPLDHDVLDDVETAIAHCRRFGKVTIIGHSIGGRLALLSSADAVIALSPAICPTYGPAIHKIIDSWSHKVREPSKAFAFPLLERLPVWKPDGRRRTLIIYGSRDMPEIARGCRKLRDAGVPAVEVPGGLHSDIFLLEPTVEAIKKELAAQG